MKKEEIAFWEILRIMDFLTSGFRMMFDVKNNQDFNLKELIKPALDL